MRISGLILSFSLVVFPLVARAQAPLVEQPLDKEALASVQAAARGLARDVEFLQEDIVMELSAQKERSLFRQVDAMLDQIDQFQRNLKPGMARAQLYKEFDGLEQNLHALLKAIKALGPEQRLLQRSAARLAAADEQLHEVLSANDASDLRLRQALEWQCQSLVTATQQLDKAAQYALGSDPGHGVFLADLHKLAAATAALQKSLDNNADRAQLESDFAAVNKAWERTIAGLQNLKPQENIYLLRTADRVERLHERLFRLLGLKGERPRLSIRT